MTQSKTPEHLKKEYKKMFAEVLCELCEYEDGVDTFRHCMNYAIGDVSSWHIKELGYLNDMQLITDESFTKQVDS
mgnify:CR=1